MRNNLRLVRHQFGWTQAELATKLGVTRQTINVIENGKYDPSLPLALKVARLCARSVESMFFLDDEGDVHE